MTVTMTVGITRMRGATAVSLLSFLPEGDARHIPLPPDPNRRDSLAHSVVSCSLIRREDSPLHCKAATLHFVFPPTLTLICTRFIVKLPAAMQTRIWRHDRA